jgi:hypothetical protein
VTTYTKRLLRSVEGRSARDSLESRIAPHERTPFHRVMNSRPLILLGLLAAAVAHGQGTVVFNNLASTSYNLVTNNLAGTAPGVMSGAGRYRIGLYAAPGAGALENSLSLVGLATNASVPGKFNGGSNFVLPIGYPAGGKLTFQLRAWTLAAGSFETACAIFNADPHLVYVAVSALGTTTAGGLSPTGPVPAGALFGTSMGNLTSGLSIYPCPEPSSAALAFLAGLAALLGRSRRKRDRHKNAGLGPASEHDVTKS